MCYSENMKLTKYIHSCLVLEDQGKKLIIDPGEFTPDFGGTDNIVGVVVTHEHGDHFSAAHLEKIVAANPGVKVFTTEEVVQKWDNNPHAQAMEAGQEETVGPFTLNFFGGLHNEIHNLLPVVQNIAVLVNRDFYYPGDSFTKPAGQIKVLALPAGAPWMKTAEAIEFLKALNPEQFFRTHDGLLNDKGLGSTDFWYNLASEKLGPKYSALSPGESIEY